VLRRSCVVVLLVLLVSACGGESQTSTPATPAGETGAKVLITTDCAGDVILEKGVDAGQTAMRALDRVAEIETDSGGKFVTAINGVEQDTGKKVAWLYYINGKAAAKGATETRLAAGDVEWWDLHNYEQECAVVPPAAR
jgi:hypothetical protein